MAFPSYYTPFAVLPQLEVYGQQGWELVAIQPVVVGKHGNVLITGAGTMGTWTSQYLCTFKRRVMIEY